MATKKKGYKVDYKSLVREIKKTLKALQAIEKKVAGQDAEDIKLQIKSLDYMAAACEGTAAKMTGKECLSIAAKMTGKTCRLLPGKMTRTYGAE
jgi:uncharacterized Ntn-hydrolase superfamily protein